MKHMRMLLVAMLLLLPAKLLAQGGVGINATTLQPTTVAGLPTGVRVGTEVPVLDGASATDCTTGGGTTGVPCIWTGSAWTAIGGTGGTVSSVTIAGTANQITASGTCTITTTGTCTLSLVAAQILGTDNSVAGSVQMANGSANAHTIWASGATTSNTIQGFATVPTTGHFIDCTVTSTMCLLHDSGVATATVSTAVGSAAAHTFWGNNTGSPATASFLRLACADLSNAANSCSTDATNASNIASGTLGSTYGGTGADLHTAASGSYAKYNGANPAVAVASTLPAAGTGTPAACTNQVVTDFTLNGDAAPTSVCTGLTASFLPTNNFFQSQYSSITAGLSATTQNHTILYSVYIPGPASYVASNLQYDVATADNTANSYDIGIFGGSGSNGCTNAQTAPRVAHTGTVAGTTLAPSTGVKTIALTGAPITIAPGFYCFAITSSGASPAFVIAGQSSSVFSVQFGSGTSQAVGGATLPANITAPAISVQSGPMPFFVLY